MEQVKNITMINSILPLLPVADFTPEAGQICSHQDHYQAGNSEERDIFDFLVCFETCSYANVNDAEIPPCDHQTKADHIRNYDIQYCILH